MTQRCFDHFALQMVGKLICSIDDIYLRICLILCGKFEKIVRGGGSFIAFKKYSEILILRF